jgi:hypothetical protein
MKRLLLLSLLLLLISNLASAQLYIIGLALYSDEEMLHCDIIDREPGVIHVYVAIMASLMSGARFKIDQLDGANLTWISDAVPVNYTTTGSSQSGITIMFDRCVEHPHIILNITYMGNGLSEPCGEIRLVSHPDEIPERLILIDCLEPPRSHTGANHSKMYINSTDSCPCYTLVPVEQTNWGHIKALYQEN